MARLKVLAIAVATGKIGYVYLIGEKLKDWGLSRKASVSTEQAAGYAQRLINDLKPDVLVTEKVQAESSKSAKTRSLIAAIERIGEHNYLLDVSVERVKRFKNKYDEAVALAERFPELLPWVPKPRRIWEPEPRNTIYFEALGLALLAISPRAKSYP
ncbi:hypothetical protein [Salaquimonas pukyongi]|uniref:hypothetical protein n=1 Tax=Salaquimonas pukyongi TaxID=2712698 RepID=UPI00096BAB86|nr:hypothetical protein [Salaquimonas pukyongi]